MALAFVQSATPGTNTTGASNTTSTSAFVSPTTTGNAIIVVVVNDGATGSVTSVTDTQGNSYSKAVINTALTTVSVEIWYALNITGGSSNVVTAHQGFNDGVIFAQEWSGVAGVSALDKTAKSTGTNASVTSGSSGTLSQASELIIGGAEMDVFSTDDITGAGSGYSNYQHASSGTVIGAIESKIVSATTSTAATFAASNSGGSSWRGVLASFKAGSAPATPTNLFFF